MTELTTQDTHMIMRLVEERERLDDQVAALRAQIRALSDEQIAKKFDTTGKHIAKVILFYRKGRMG